MRNITRTLTNQPAMSFQGRQAGAAIDAPLLAGLTMAITPFGCAASR